MDAVAPLGRRPALEWMVDVSLMNGSWEVVIVDHSTWEFMAICGSVGNGTANIFGLDDA